MINTSSISPGRALAVMTSTLKTGIPFYIHGEPGIGKSELVEQLAANLGMNVTVQMLTQMEATGLRGLEFIDETIHRTVNYAPEWLPGPNDPPTIVFLDELSAAEHRLQVSAYQLLLSHRIGSFVLDPKHYVCGAGNRVDDGAVAHEIGTALASRLLHIQMEANPEDWVNWATKNGVHPAVITFIKMKGHMISGLEKQLKEKRMIGPNPRNWVRVSRVLQKSGTSARAVLEPMIEGLIGTGAAQDFLISMEEFAGLPELDILINMNDKQLKDLFKKLTIPNLWGMAFSLVGYADDPDKNLRGMDILGIMEAHANDDAPLGEIRRMGMELLIERSKDKKYLKDMLQKKAFKDYLDEVENIYKLNTASLLADGTGTNQEPSFSKKKALVK